MKNETLPNILSSQMNSSGSTVETFIGVMLEVLKDTVGNDKLFGKVLKQ